MAFAAWLASCNCEEPPPLVPPAPVPAPRAGLVAPRPLASAASFDLIDNVDGALLAWGVPSRMGGGLQVQRLDRQGGAIGEEISILSPTDMGGPRAAEELPGDAVELALQAVGTQFAVAWVIRDQRQIGVRSVVCADAGERVGPGVDHGPTELGRIGVRGHLALAASRAGEISLFFRGVTAPCEGDGIVGPCTRFSPVRLGTHPGDGVRDGVSLAVPVPCERAIPGFENIRDDWYYSICSGEGEGRITTAFAIRFDPEYAHPERVMAGCEAIGMTAHQDGVLLVSRCEDGLRGVQLADAGRQRELIRGLTRRVRCVAGRPTIEIGAAEGVTMQTRLEGRRGRLGPLLPEQLAGAAARAIWTGEALLVAKPMAGEVNVQRYECEHGELTRTNPLL